MRLARKRVCIVGGGAAGMAAAWSMGQHGDQFEVEMWEKASVPGGVATSIDVGGGMFINDGVQGYTPTYRNVVNIHKSLGITHTPVEFTVSFGKDETCWNNWRERDLVARLRPEIKRFGDVLKWIQRMEPLSVLWPISLVLNVTGFPEEFGDLMVYPLVALFFGTGNQTPRISSAVVARVFLDPDLRLFHYCPERLLNMKPRMFAFDNLEEVYSKMAKSCGDNVKVLCNKTVSRVVRSSDLVYVYEEGSENPTEYDEIILACDAETSLRILEKPTYWERKCLGNVEYYDDVTFTHEDRDYMHKYYDVDINTDQYFVRTDPQDRKKIEMSFNLSNYQPQLKHKPNDRNIFQTIFLDKRDRAIWTEQDISKDKILCEKWWRQMTHTWRHFASVPPLVRFIQGTKHTWYCGSWTLANTHEVATISGLTVAHRLGAEYPFTTDEFACKQFDFYIEAIHGTTRTPRSCCSRFGSKLWFGAKVFGASIVGLLLLPFALLALLGVFLKGRVLRSRATQRLRHR
ncbi:uncharacterized protein LOC135496939 [Lineus longissimus]|uniref:uncharacterized protein LOC135496939 n=1 Tax=Lineus longissimus TaxID=88925 RepID=UPI002B4F1683